LASLVFLVGCSNTAPHADLPMWPDPSEVERILASVSDQTSGQPDLPEFEVPPEFVPAVVRVLSPPEYHEPPPAKHTQSVGRLRVICRDGRELVVGLVFYGKEPVLFTVNGVPCIRGGPYNETKPGSDMYLPEVYAVEGLLRHLHAGERVKALECVQRLDKSAGRAVRGAE